MASSNSLPARNNGPASGAANKQVSPFTQPRTTRNQTSQTRNTWGALNPVDIQPLDALIDDIKRTQGHILWLEEYIAQLPRDAPFQTSDNIDQAELESTFMGRPQATNPGPHNPATPNNARTKWHAQIERQRQQRQTTLRPGTHPAITQLQTERRHLADAVYKAVVLGIKLDQIDYSRQQGDLIIKSMQKFAIANGIDPTSREAAQAMQHALQATIEEQQAQA
jgi:hypothetical protein